MDDPIYILGYAIAEPTVAATNLLICAFSIYWFIKLKPLSNKYLAIKYWQWFFGFTALAALVGAFAHATRPYEAFWGTSLFKVAWILGGLGVSAVQMSATVLLKSEKLRKILSKLIIVQFVLFVIALFVYHHFMWVNINSAIGILAVLAVVHTGLFMKEKLPASRLILTAIFILLFVLLVKGFEMRLFIFNHHDLAHFIVIISMYFFYQGAIKLEGREIVNA